jgi:hypothetical protein
MDCVPFLSRRRKRPSGQQGRDAAVYAGWRHDQGITAFPVNFPEGVCKIFFRSKVALHQQVIYQDRSVATCFRILQKKPPGL